jgi:hypothetical protein
MDIKLTPLIIFLLLLFLLIFTIIYKNEFNSLFPEKWNISEAIFSNNEASWYNSEAYENSATRFSDALQNGFTRGTNVPPLNVTPVYDISLSIVRQPERGKIYYDSSGQPLNFPVNELVYDEIGNVIMTPPLVGLMADYTGYPINLPFYDLDGKEIIDLANFFGPVYDSYHNQIEFPYIDSTGSYAVSSVMTPSLFQLYVEYMTSINNTTSSNKYSEYTDASCVFGCVNYNQSLDSYINDYYQHFWNQYKQMYSDDYVLKTSLPNIPNTQCNPQNWSLLHTHNDLGNKTASNNNTKGDASGNNVANNVANNAGNGAQNFATAVGKNTKAVVDGVGDTIGDIGSGAQKFVTTVGKDTQAVVAEVGDTITDIGTGAHKLVTTIGGDIKAVVGAVGSGVNSALATHPTHINGQYSTTGSRGLAGNYGGDNSASNTGYMKGTNQFSASSTNGVATYDNHYNAKPAQSSDFIPVTADFSKFGR